MHITGKRFEYREVHKPIPFKDRRRGAWHRFKVGLQEVRLILKSKTYAQAELFEILPTDPAYETAAWEEAYFPDISGAVPFIQLRKLEDVTDSRRRSENAAQDRIKEGFHKEKIH